MAYSNAEGSSRKKKATYGKQPTAKARPVKRPKPKGKRAS